jgi:hypothetical protein
MMGQAPALGDRRFTLILAVVLICWLFGATPLIALDPDRAMRDSVFKTWTPEERSPTSFLWPSSPRP